MKQSLIAALLASAMLGSLKDIAAAKGDIILLKEKKSTKKSRAQKARKKKKAQAAAKIKKKTTDLPTKKPAIVPEKKPTTSPTQSPTKKPSSSQVTTGKLSGIINLSDRKHADLAEQTTSLKTFESAINSGNVVVKYSASWCGYCGPLSQVIASIENNYPDVAWVEVDTDKFRTLTQQAGITGLPTLIFYRNGEKVLRKSGGLPKGAVEAALRNAYGY